MLPVVSKIQSTLVSTVMFVLVLSSCDSATPEFAGQSRKLRAAQQNDALSIIRFKGICDGSAAVRLPDDNLLIAYDEQNTLYAFAPTGGTPLREYDYGQALGVQDEVDVEAAVLTLTGRHIWWIGSHGNDGDGDHAESRQWLFKTPVLVNLGNNIGDEAGNEGVDNTARDLVTKFQIELHDRINLLPVLLKQGQVAGLLNESLLQLKPKKGGINIEGLSVMDNGDLLLGLRSPLSAAGDAIVAQIGLAGMAPSVKRFYQLELGGRGIRDLKVSTNGYLMIAGDVDSGGEFSIYRWVPGADPMRLLELPQHFNAEALVDVGTHWLVLSDDGKVKRSDESAADGDRRCDSIRLDNPLADKHPSVFFRALILDQQTLR